MSTKPDNPVQVACIIPAFNEAGTVASVARIARGHRLVNSVVVVDDGSDDRTGKRAGEIDGVKVIRLEANRGKGAAMAAGLAGSSEPVVLFLDADLIGLKSEHVTDLLEPVISSEAEMSVGLFRGGRLHTDLAHVLTPSLSGQRAVRRHVIEEMDMESVGFGIERALTDLWKTGKITVKEVILQGVTHLTKEEKRGYWSGVKQRWKMYGDILRYEADRLKRRIQK